MQGPFLQEPLRFCTSSLRTPRTLRRGRMGVGAHCAGGQSRCGSSSPGLQLPCGCRRRWTAGLPLLLAWPVAALIVPTCVCMRHSSGILLHTFSKLSIINCLDLKLEHVRQGQQRHRILLDDQPQRAGAQHLEADTHRRIHVARVPRPRVRAVLRGIITYHTATFTSPAMTQVKIHTKTQLIPHHPQPHFARHKLSRSRGSRGARSLISHAAASTSTLCGDGGDGDGGGDGAKKDGTCQSYMGGAPLCAAVPQHQPRSRPLPPSTMSVCSVMLR